MKTFDSFIAEAKIVGQVDPKNLISTPRKKKKKKTYTDNNYKPKQELSYDPEVNKAFVDLNKVVEKYAIIDEVGFRGHMAIRVKERNLWKNILSLFEKLKRTKFYKDLPNNYKEYTKDKNRRFGPQLVDERTKTHVGTEIIKTGGKISIVPKSVMGDFGKDYIKNIKKHPCKPRFYFA